MLKNNNYWCSTSFFWKGIIRQNLWVKHYSVKISRLFKEKPIVIVSCSGFTADSYQLFNIQAEVKNTLLLFVTHTKKSIRHISLFSFREGFGVCTDGIRSPTQLILRVYFSFRTCGRFVCHLSADC